MSKLALSRLAGAATDQALLSLVNFAISILLIRLAPKSDYGLYVLFLSPIYLIQGIQNALLLSPYMTRVAGKQCSSKETALGLVTLGNLALVGVVFASTILASDIYIAMKELPAGQYLNWCIAFGAIGWIAREASRTTQYSDSNVAGALLGNLIYSVVVVAYLAYAWIVGEVRVEGIFVSIGIGGILSVLRISRAKISTNGFSEELAGFWALGKWAIVGVLLTWFNSNYYPFFVESVFGLGALAEISAARLFLMPFVLLLPAWANHFRPEFARWYEAGERKRIGSVTRASVLAIGAILTVYGLLIWSFQHNLSSAIGNDYQDVGHLIVAWCVYFAFFAFRNLNQATLMVDVSGYRNLSRVSTVSFIVLWPALYMSTAIGPAGLIYALAFIELLQWLWIWRLASRYWKENAA